MVITVNDLKEEVPGGITVKGLIEFVKEGDPDLIVEQNGKYIYPRDYEKTFVKENDVFELINPNLGG